MDHKEQVEDELETSHNHHVHMQLLLPVLEKLVDSDQSNQLKQPQVNNQSWADGGHRIATDVHGQGSNHVHSKTIEVFQVLGSDLMVVIDEVTIDVVEGDVALEVDVNKIHEVTQCQDDGNYRVAHQVSCLKQINKHTGWWQGVDSSPGMLTSGLKLIVAT